MIEAGLAALIAADHPVTTEWVDESVLDTNPGLVRTLSVKPPRGTGRLRLVRIGDVDLQPCGGTHVGSTAQIGVVRVLKIENKGRPETAASAWRSEHEHGHPRYPRTGWPTHWAHLTWWCWRRPNTSRMKARMAAKPF